MAQSKKTFIALAAVVAIAAIAFLSACGGAKGSTDEVRFQNASDPGPDPFTAPADVPKGSSGSSASSTSSSSSSSSGAPSSGSSSPGTGGSGGSSTPEPPDPSASGSSGSSGSESTEPPKPGTFGGTGDNTVCDREKLVEQLAADPDKLSAWAETVGIEADEQTVADFIRKLRPSTLTKDTQVTNHSFSDGSANAYQAILPKGTAVLVDASGKPVARCRCGNPLTEPAQLEKQTKCFNCPANYQPPPPCGDKCFKEERNPPPVKKGPVVIDPIVAYQACRSSKPVLEKLEGCKTEYEKARQVCAADPLNPGCDASVCLEQVISPFTTACASYLENIDTGLDKQCAGKPTQAAKDACVAEARDERIRCAQVPTGPKCKVNPNFRLSELRKFCVMNPSRPDCKALQIGCAKDSSQPGCKALQDKCAADPARPDCKAVSDLKQKCSKAPKQPGCKDLPIADEKQTVAPDLEGQEKSGDQEGDQGTGAEGTGQDPGAGESGGGGQAPGTGDPVQPETENTPTP